MINKIKKILCAFLIGLFCFSLTYAQNAREDFTRINEFYIKNTKISMEAEYAVYLDNNTVAYEKETGSYKRNGRNIYMKQMDYEIIQNEKYVSVASHDEKVIALDKNKGADTDRKFPDMNLDSIFKIYKEVKFYIPSSVLGAKAYSFVLAGGIYESVDVVFDATRFYVISISMVYRNMIEEQGKKHKTKMVITYSNVNTEPNLSSRIFSEDQFVQKTKGGFVLQPKYKNYEFINHLSKNG